MLYAAHQPDLLPYSGFWYKVAKADVFDLKVWDQYVNRGYQRRAIMRDQWTTLPLEPGSSYDPIFEKRLKPEAPQVLSDCIYKRYGDKSTGTKGKFWDYEDRGEQVMDEILSIRTDMLWEFNFRLILFMRDLLGIETPLTFGRPVQDGLKGSAGLISAMKVFPRPLTYLSGPGARTYMGDCAEFKAENIPVIFSPHDPVTGDSILTVLFDYEDPMSLILREKTESDSDMGVSA